MGGFARYKDVDNDGIGYRTLPGTDHPLAAYFARGTGHDEKAQYSERADVWEANLVRFLDSRRVDLVFADEGTTHHYAQLFHQLRRQGTPIPTNDLWIAALVVQHDLHLFARDAHFDHLSQIPRL